jgi:hypothetical protein
MFYPVFEGIKFSYYYEHETEQYMLYWAKYGINIILKDEDASIFKQQIEMINSEPEKDVKKRIERAISIYFYFRYTFPMPHFAEG